MKYFSGEDAKNFKTENCAIALGKFDGIHVGHQLIMAGLLEEQKNGKKALVFSFGDNPFRVLRGDAKKNIYTTEEKIKYFDELGIDILLEYPFTKKFASYEPEEFVKNCLVEALGVKEIYVGDDFCFGKNRMGNVNTLIELGKEYQFQVHEIKQVYMDDIVVSSTTVRELLVQNFEMANKMLGNPYFIYGEVVHGKQLGNTIGFPTINQKIADYKVVPQYGVYQSRISIDGTVYTGISNLGVKPTIKGENQLGLETFILDYNGDLYGKMIKTELISFVREEKKFENIEALKNQITKDIEAIKIQAYS